MPKSLIKPSKDPHVPISVKALFTFALRPYRRQTIVFFFLSFLGVLSWNASIYSASQLINELSNSGKVTNAAWVIVALFAFFRVIDEIFWRIAEVVARNTKPQLVERVRSELFAATLKKPHTFFVNSSSGRIAHWINQTVNSVDAVINSTIWGVWGELLGLILSTVFLLTTHWSLALLFAVWMIALFTYNNKRGKKFSALVAAESDVRSSASSIVVDSVSNSQNVRVFNAREHEARVLHRKQEEIVTSWRKSWRFATRTNMIKGQSSAWVNVGAICLAVWLFGNGTIEIGGLALFLAYFNSASAGLWTLAWYFDEYYRQFGTLQNALDGLEGDSERGVAVDEVPLPDKVSLQIDSLSFSYPEAKNDTVLSNLTLSVSAGQKVGIVGHSGAGKSTLVGLLLGFYEPTGGSIYINDINVLEKDPSFIRGVSAYVPQDTSMFNRSIRENILYSKPEATEEQVLVALKKANALTFVEKLPNGLDTLVGERGVKLSGGQRQRIAIARAILKGAPLLLLDEATSALDSVSEQAIQKALHELMKDRTAVVIAHRLSTLKHLDKIIVIEKGSIVEEGTHDELLEIEDGFYADLWKRQKDGFIVE